VGIFYVKALHVIFMVTWFAGLFYLPRLFVYHAMTKEAAVAEQLKVMERKLWVMTNIGGVLTTVFGLWLLFSYGWSQYHQMGWLHAKLTLVVLLIVYHAYCGKLVADFKHDRNRRSHKWYRMFNELPTLLLIGIVILVMCKPF
jgi:putative membrane protein